MKARSREAVARHAAVAGAVLLAASAAGSGPAAARQADQSRPHGRDLVFESAEGETFELPAVPRGYALVIGVGEYRNLDEGKQLLFARSDAEAMYRVLIS